MVEIKKTQGNDIDYLTKDVYHVMLKIALLSRIRKGRCYSYELFRDITKHFNKVKNHKNISFKPNIKNDIYNTISSLENAGYIKAAIKVEGSKVKNYYTITIKGARALDGAKAAFRRTVREVMELVS